MAKTLLLFGEKGKTVIAFGLLKRFMQEGLKVGYFKPIARATYKLPSLKYAAADVIAIKEALGLPEPIEILNPVVISRTTIELKNDIDTVKKTLEESFSSISEGKDIVVVESYSSPEALACIGLSVVEMAKMFNAKSVLVIDAKDRDIVDEILDRIYLYKFFFDKQDYPLDGVIINNVPIYFLERINDVIVPLIRDMGLKVYGVLSERSGLLSPTVHDIVESIDAEVLENKDKLSNVVEDIVVGAMSPSAALRWFRRASNAAIITGGDRTDLILVALESKPSVVILTGNLYPDVTVLVKAKELGVPLLLTPYDTYTTVTKLREVWSRVTADSLKVKEKEIVEAINKGVDWRALLE
uniref:Phosphotransacetylase family protein n=1 Tax=Ignisphaera aggregans TaxID=334771 RepID=A0A7C2VLM4_9CREN